MDWIDGAQVRALFLHLDHLDIDDVLWCQAASPTLTPQQWASVAHVLGLEVPGDGGKAIPEREPGS